VTARALVVDTSVLIAINDREELADLLLGALERAGLREIAAPSVVEAGMVLRGRAADGSAVQRSLQRLLIGLDITVAPFDAEQAWAALDAHRRFGKGRGHPARLNLGDTFSYALAKVRGAPLLFVGEDFSRTDITPAL
jgi:ribonuclease VapC